ncbi:hypothetical protein VZT92_007415 [Zoarces viviparus]|uniref:Uncharacterized protein n=1 Tax=Zoarces viviparus TaxID=48416 RepID=A0AAW1FLC2_ZOAVI
MSDDGQARRPVGAGGRIKGCDEELQAPEDGSAENSCSLNSAWKCDSPTEPRTGRQKAAALFNRRIDDDDNASETVYL